MPTLSTLLVYVTIVNVHICLPETEVVDSKRVSKQSDVVTVTTMKEAAIFVLSKNRALFFDSY